MRIHNIAFRPLILRLRLIFSKMRPSATGRAPGILVLPAFPNDQDLAFPLHLQSMPVSLRLRVNDVILKQGDGNAKTCSCGR